MKKLLTLLFAAAVALTLLAPSAQAKTHHKKHHKKHRHHRTTRPSTPPSAPQR